MQVLFEDELQRCQEHTACEVEVETGLHLGGVLRLTLTSHTWSVPE
jgi:hypothetical protein